MQTTKTNSNPLSNMQSMVLTVLRIIVGWHFLYEGISKMLIPGWTSAGFLENSRWIFADFFHWMAANPAVLRVVDLLNIWGLTLIGLALILGVVTRLASFCGICLLGIYYIANPPFIGIDFGIPTEGHYLFVNKNLIEMMALVIFIVFPARSLLGLDRIILFVKGMRTAKAPSEQQSNQEDEALTNAGLNRRELLLNFASIPILGAFILGTARKYEWEKLNAITGATIKVSDTTLRELKGELPQGKIGNHQLSRLIMGGNLIGGWAHSRDLIYVSALFKAYNNERTVFETLELAEKAGINSMNVTVNMFKMINKYKRIYKSRLKTICQVHPTKKEPFGDIDQAIDAGVDLIQIQGNCCDWRVMAGEIDVLEKAIDYIKKQGYPAGLGAHSIQALIECEKVGIQPDFYMKTLHHDQYWSAHPMPNRIPYSVDGEKSLHHDEFHDNIFCLFPEATIDFMKRQTIPLIGFKVLAGGAIHPKDGFKFAFENGADFICVGMFDFQIVDDVNICLEVLSKLEQRERTWCA